MYTTNSSEACEYIANHSETELIVLEDHSYLSKYYSIIANIPKVKYFVLFRGEIPQDIPEPMKGKVVTWLEFMQLGSTK